MVPGSPLDRRYTQEEIQTVYGENEWQCGSQRTAFGDSLCVAKIGTFNGFPARLVTFYFRDDNVSALKLIYRDQYHKQITGYVIGEFGQPTNVESAIAAGPDADSVLEWDVGKGVLLIKKELGKTDEPWRLRCCGWPAAPHPESACTGWTATRTIPAVRQGSARLCARILFES